MKPKPMPPLNACLCRRLAMVCKVCGALFLLVNATLWLVPDWAPLVARSFANLQTQMITLTPMVRVIGLAGSTLYLGVLVRGLWVASQLFGRLAEGLVFEAQTGVLLRRFGLTLLLYAALTPVLSTLTGLLVTMHNPPHHHIAQFAVSDHEVVLAIVGTLILMTGSVMAEAARLAEDNRQII